MPAIRAAAAKAGGHATLFRGDDALKTAVGVFQPLTEPLARIHRNLKQRLRSAGGVQPRPDVSRTLKVR
jgi:glycolate oxidase FAD binding subunit